MSNPVQEIKGAIVIQGLPETECFTTFEEMLTVLSKYLVLQLPIGLLTNVLVSNIEPLDSQRDSVWFRQDNSGHFLGVYIFASGSWKLAFPSPNQVIWMFGDSGNVPEGYSLIDHNNVHFTNSQADQIMLFYRKTNPGDSTYFYFAVTFEGL